jgi:PEGA domain-containing protein
MIRALVLFWFILWVAPSVLFPQTDAAQAPAAQPPATQPSAAEPPAPQGSAEQNPPAKAAQEPAAQPAAPAQKQTAAKNPKGFVLEDGTPVRLKTGRNISSADAHVGDTLDFEVLEDVRVAGLLVIPKGGIAFATVTEAQSKRRMARGGKLNVNIDSVRLVTHEKAPLRAIKEVKGGGHTGVMTTGIVATSIVFFPAAPVFLFMHGKDITIPKGTEITAYVNGDVQLDRAKFEATQAQAPAAAPSSTAAPAQEQNGGAQLEVSSTPDAADIEIDGKFVGSTPSSVGVTPGEHDLIVKKSGFKPWEKKIAVSSGHVKVDAQLEAESK